MMSLSGSGRDERSDGSSKPCATDRTDIAPLAELDLVHPLHVLGGVSLGIRD
jgi:hypothetical protein